MDINENVEEKQISASQFMAMKGLQMFSYAIEKLYPEAHTVVEWEEIIKKEGFN